MAKKIESQREEAYKGYVSDTLALFSRFVTGGEVEIPRYSDMIKPIKPEKVEEQNSEDIMAKFNTLRRTE